MSTLRATAVGLAASLTPAAGAAGAQDYWPLERIAAAEAAAAVEAVHLGPPAAPGPAPEFTVNAPDLQLLEEASFIRDLQVTVPTSTNFGGMREGEALLNIVQTDNTTESVWVWSRYQRLTGDTQFSQNVQDAWTYIGNHPAYLEEGGGGSLGYYRVYNCAWALIAEMEYRRATGDHSRLAYAQTCADYLTQNALAFDSISPVLMVQVQAWAAGALYLFGLDRGNAAWRNFAVQQGDRARQEAEADPLLLQRESWAMSGGAIVWGVLNSYYREHPGARSWAITWGSATDVLDANGQWRIAHTAWYGLGRHAAWEASADPQFLTTHRTIYEQLLFGDGDDDGGIPTTQYMATDEDESWVSNYMAFMAIDKVRPPFDAAIGSDHVHLSPGDVWHLALGVGNHDAFESFRYCLLSGIEGPGGYTLDVLPERKLALPALGVLGASLPVALPSDAPHGRYTATLEVRTLQGVLADRARVTATVQ